MSNRSRLTWNTALLRRGFATLILAAGAAVVAPGNGFAKIGIVDASQKMLCACQPMPCDGAYTILHEDPGRYMDAYGEAEKKWRLVTRPEQSNDSQVWILTNIRGNEYNIQQKWNLRYVDAHESAEGRYRVVTRPEQSNDSQVWILENVGGNAYTIQQKSTQRYLDAFKKGDHELVTNLKQEDNTQRWILAPAAFSESKAPPPWLKEATRDWMASISNDVKLHEISIPGTHESAAHHGGKWAECQRWSIKEQLEAGIRYLDIRVRRYNDGFTIHHGPHFQEIMFSGVMRDVNQFLSAHPSETVLMRVQEVNPDLFSIGEWDVVKAAEPVGSRTFEWIWESQMQKYGKDSVWDNGDPETCEREFDSEEIPSIGQVRGKIVVLRDNRYKNDDKDKIPCNWGLKYGGRNPLCGRKETSPESSDANDSVMEIQDCYKVSKEGVGAPISLESKKSTIKKYILKAGAADNDKLVLNHLSGVNYMGDGPDISPLDVARETNPYTYNYIGDYVGQRTLGVLIMDFPGPQLVCRIVQSNR